MLAKRIIPCLDVKEGRVVKGVKFENLRDAGDPVELAAFYDAEGADELTFLDITASSGGRDTMYDVVRRTAELLNRRGDAMHGSTVLLLGVAYKPDVSDLRGTPALPIARQLIELGANVSYHDPLVPDWEVDGKPVPSVIDLDEAVASHDLVILLQRHSCYDDELFTRCALLFDSCGAARSHAAEVL